MLLVMLVIWLDLVGELLQQVGEHEQPFAQPQLALDHQVAAVAQQHGHVQLA